MDAIQEEAATRTRPFDAIRLVQGALRGMKQDSVEIGGPALASAMSSCLAGGQERGAEAAWAIFEAHHLKKMKTTKDGGVGDDVDDSEVFCAALRAAVAVDDPVRMARVLLEINTARGGAAADGATYRILAAHAASKGDVDGVVGILAEMRSLGLHDDAAVASRTALVQAQALSGNVDAALETALETSGTNGPPGERGRLDAYTTTILRNALGRSSAALDALDRAGLRAPAAKRPRRDALDLRSLSIVESRGHVISWLREQSMDLRDPASSSSTSSSSSSSISSSSPGNATAGDALGLELIVDDPEPVTHLGRIKLRGALEEFLLTHLRIPYTYRDGSILVARADLEAFSKRTAKRVARARLLRNRTFGFLVLPATLLGFYVLIPTLEAILSLPPL